jgi:hypothetical protein
MVSEMNEVEGDGEWLRIGWFCSEELVRCSWRGEGEGGGLVSQGGRQGCLALPANFKKKKKK